MSSSRALSIDPWSLPSKKEDGVLVASGRTQQLSEGAGFTLKAFEHSFEGAAQERRASTLASWREVEPSLGSDARDLARSFVALCEQCSAFLCDPGCSVDVDDDGDVIFDWNNGTVPMFSAAITADLKIIHVGKFNAGAKVTGEDVSLRSVKEPLKRLVEELGNFSWNTIASSDLWLAVATQNQVVELPYTPPLGTVVSLSSRRMARDARTLKTRGDT